MENPVEKKESRSIGWFTNPLYKVMIVLLALLYALEHYIDEGTKHALLIVLWIALGLIVIANVIALFEFFQRKRK